MNYAPYIAAALIGAAILVRPAVWVWRVLLKPVRLEWEDYQ
jgi:hypothetical protein